MLTSDSFIQLLFNHLHLFFLCLCEDRKNKCLLPYCYFGIERILNHLLRVRNEKLWLSWESIWKNITEICSHSLVNCSKHSIIFCLDQVKTQRERGFSVLGLHLRNDRYLSSVFSDQNVTTLLLYYLFKFLSSFL